MAVSQAFIFHFKCYCRLHFAVCQLLCCAFLYISLRLTILPATASIYFAGQYTCYIVYMSLWPVYMVYRLYVTLASIHCISFICHAGQYTLYIVYMSRRLVHMLYIVYGLYVTLASIHGISFIYLKLYYAILGSR